ncbi:putative ribose phosphate diphosphokinase Prs1 [Microthyrium microscopicum]|uniref:Ribose-phosphate pyrophosphokinase 1 n=1 Tax=Microthyrium microscopicum TaxID=703497 RepID=A0A6A6U911_9PEZI|nr:putative ribose phosphate diphosphokinase Prs1 [Microthyrium microscopicum]
MRQTQIFGGSSHPVLVESICDWLGQKPGEVDLGKFSNGETSVQIRASIRNQDVFIVQSGSTKMNDSVIELLIMCSACKGGSAKSITAVMPYFPYNRQSKKKSHRGAITARMIANLLAIAGVDHVITLDLHANQMQGFFKCPVDNLVAEPLLARWIRHNIKGWENGVVVSKNPGGTKRVTSLADALKLNFGIVTTDRRQMNQPHQSMDFSLETDTPYYFDDEYEADVDNEVEQEDTKTADATQSEKLGQQPEGVGSEPTTPSRPSVNRKRTISNSARRRNQGTGSGIPSSPLSRSALPGNSPEDSPSLDALVKSQTEPAIPPSLEQDLTEEFTDERARDVTVGRLRHGHIVPEDYPSPAFSAVSGSNHGLGRQRGPQSENGDTDRYDPMTASFMSTVSSIRHDLAADNALGGSVDAAASSEEEEEDLRNPDLETTVTLVGNVRDRPVFIVDDIIDKAGSWIAAAETVVKRGGATKVYCVATHGLFGEDCLQEIEESECIDLVIVTNSFPIEAQVKARMKKLVQLDIAPLLSEAIRRNHYGENLSQLYMHLPD